MTVKNQELIAAGFSSKDIERIKRYQSTGDSQDKILKELSNHFLAVAWIAAGLAIIPWRSRLSWRTQLSSVVEPTFIASLACRYE